MKIALITDASGTDVLMARCVEGWIESLASHSHNLRIYTNFRNDQTELRWPASVEVVRPFANWSVTEFFRTIPVLVEQRPEIIILIPTLASTQKLWQMKSWVWLLLQTLSKVIQPAPRLATLQVQSSNSNDLQSWLELQSDMNINLPPIFKLTESTRVHDHAKKPNYILVPGPVDQIENLQGFALALSEACLQDETLEVIIAGDWGKTPLLERQKFAATMQTYHCQARWHLTGWDRNTEFEWYQSLVQNASALWLVGVKLDLRDKVLLAHHALQCKTPVALGQADQNLINPDVGLATLESEALSQIKWLADRAQRSESRARLLAESEGPDQQSNHLNRNLFRLLSLHG